MSEIIKCPEPYYTTVLPLLKAIPVQRWGDFKAKEFEIPLGWEIVGSIRSECKLKAIHKEAGLFAKLFPPSLQTYSDVTEAALHELSRLPISIPILPSIGFSREQGISALLFQLGEPIYRDRFVRVYPEEECELINHVVESYELGVLSPTLPFGDRIEVISLNGLEYAIDPINDNTNNISNYVEAHGGRQPL